jgi:excisionase family DNA binding protein
MAAMPPEPPEFYTVSEVAKLLRVGHSTVVRWIQLGQLRAVRLPSGVYRVPKSEVARLLRQLEEP